MGYWKDKNYMNNNVYKVHTSTDMTIENRYILLRAEYLHEMMLRTQMERWFMYRAGNNLRDRDFHQTLYGERVRIILSTIISPTINY